ncbi:hypothetical protein SS50377_21292 [Spironucleus salmonicida]|uniref:Uncharacterized protein n=1 Tax=Spironucleus salmonicida TaxID=348837 RepID=A0A9P8S2D3_9EUKA|nr:hypothetical protein SS50377_21292 [Spironucleus salmonicida]
MNECHLSKNLQKIQTDSCQTSACDATLILSVQFKILNDNQLVLLVISFQTNIYGFKGYSIKLLYIKILMVSSHQFAFIQTVFKYLKNLAELSSLVRSLLIINISFVISKSIFGQQLKHAFKFKFLLLDQQYTHRMVIQTNHKTSYIQLQEGCDINY